jgi:DNA-binding beta-propeller fold protein YncE
MHRIAYLVLLLTMAACSSPSPTAPDTVAASDPTHALFWPPLPAQERVRFLQFFSTPADLGYREPFSKRLKDMLGGATSQGMVRPYAIAVNDRITAVGDPGVSAVHLFNHKKRNYQLLRMIDGVALSSPVGVALGDNRLFIADSLLQRVFVLDQNQRLRMELDHFERPTGLAYDAQTKRLYVADTLAHRVVEVNENGDILRAFGERGSADGQFNFPTHLAVGGGRLFINDTMNFRIQVFDLASGAHLASVGEHGDSAGYLAQPKGVALSAGQQMYIAESVSGSIQIFNLRGEFLLDFGGEGYAPGQFRFPAGLAISGNRLYVADSGNGRIQIFELRNDN